MIPFYGMGKDENEEFCLFHILFEQALQKQIEFYILLY